MTGIFRIAVSREQRIVGLITVSAAGNVTATTAEGAKSFGRFSQIGLTI
jgi:hypothetical protein